MGDSTSEFLGHVMREGGRLKWGGFFSPFKNYVDEILVGKCKSIKRRHNWKTA